MHIIITTLKGCHLHVKYLYLSTYIYDISKIPHPKSDDLKSNNQNSISIYP